MIAELTELAIKEGSGTAASRMRQLKMDPKHHFTSHVVMGVISNLQRAKYMKESTALLSVAVEIFPENALLLIRMGEVELSRGNSEVAARFFACAAAADPLNQTARAQLAKLGVAQK